MKPFDIKKLKIAILSPIAWPTPPHHYGPWQQVASWITERLVAAGAEVTLFATTDSTTKATLKAIVPSGYEDRGIHARTAWECLHISDVFENAGDFDLIHNNFDFLPLSYSQLVTTPMVTTIHGFSSPDILPVYRKYSGKTNYVSISNANRNPDLEYLATVYHGIDPKQLIYSAKPEEYLLFFGRISKDKGTKEAIAIAKQSGRQLIMAGIIPEPEYFEHEIKPHIDDRTVVYAGSVGPEDRNALLGNAAALLHPINFDEPFGLSVIEAMACGTPVIAINRGSMPELIVDGKTGFLVHTLDEAVAAIERIPEINRADCRQHVEEKFTVERMVAGYIEVYRKILEG
jgi:glycosyltransferase involved in cell wall biosynthesis